MIHPLAQVWTARYYDGRRPLRHEVELRLSEDGLKVVRDQQEEFWRWEELRQVSGDYEGEQLGFERAGSDPPESIVVPDPRFLAAIRQHAPNAPQRWASERTRVGWPRVMLAGVAAFALAGAFYFWGTRMLAELAAEVIPVSVEETLGEAVANSLAPEEDRCDSEELVAALNEIVGRLEATAGDQPYSFRVVVARNGMVNAFAAPGGHIVVFTGLVERSEKPEELAAVLAHEMQHVIQQHSTRALVGQMGARAVLALLTGDSGSGSMVMEGAATLVDLHYFRSDEEAADEGAIEMLRAAGIDPAALADFFTMIQEEGGDIPDAIQYLSTHPATGERIERIRVAAGEAFEARPLLEGVNWAELRKGCGN